MERTHNLYRVSTKQQVDKEKDDIPMQRLAVNLPKSAGGLLHESLKKKAYPASKCRRTTATPFRS